MTRLPLPGSFRARMLVIVLAVGVLPLVLLAVWLTGATARSGQALLEARLREGMEDAVRRIGASWTRERSRLQDLADSGPLREAPGTGDSPPPLAREWLDRNPGVRRLTLHAAAGDTIWDLAPPASAGPGVVTAVPVHSHRLGPRIGSLRAVYSPESLLGAGTPVVAGMVIGAFDPSTDVPLSALPFDPLLLLENRFALGDEEWLTLRRRVAEPALVLVAAAPLTPYVAPFREAARGGLLVLGAAASAALVLVLLLTGRQTRSLERLAAAADAVREGRWDGRVEERGTDEVARVAGAFNSMTESLDRTMAELADRRALAAVGEFAASLAHEIRNPLTSIQLDLQMVEERLPVGDRLGREVQARALAELRRLDASVAGALYTAKSARMGDAVVDLVDVLRAAAKACRPALTDGRTLETHADAPVLVRGDRGALVQLTLNLLLNAAQAVDPGGRIIAHTETNGESVRLVVEDDGPGIPESETERVFEPLYTTRKGGTGLGLAIARRLARAHGGDVTLEPAVPRGTRAVVALPRAEALQRAPRS